MSQLHCINTTQGAAGEINGEAAWRQYHTLIALAQRKVAAIHGVDEHNGVKGLFVALHGYSGEDYADGGSPYTLYGFRLSGVHCHRNRSQVHEHSQSVSHLLCSDIILSQ